MKSQLLLVFLLSLVSAKGVSATLTLNDYLVQANGSGSAGQSAALKDQSTELALRASEQITAIRANASASYFDDGRPTLNPSFQGTNTLAKNYSLGLSQQSLYGPKWSASLNQAETLIADASLLGENNHFFDFYPKLEVSVPLWRNFFGSETKASVEQLKNQTQAARAAAKANLAQKNIEAEIAYYKLAIARQQLKISKDSLDRAQKIMSWTESRARKNLGEESDFLQAKAAVQARLLELNQLENSVGDLERQFNIIRGINSSTVKEELELKPLKVEELNLPKETRKRLDLTASEYNLKSTESGSQLQVEASTPTLEIQYQTLTQGRGRDSAAAYKSYGDGKYDQWALAIQLSTALDWTLSGDLKKAAKMDVEAAKLQLKRDQLDSDEAWESLRQKAQLLKSSLAIANDLEALQEKKAKEERFKLTRGRSTTFQTLNFEQDYANARLNLLNLELQSRQLISQLKLFE